MGIEPLKTLVFRASFTEMSMHHLDHYYFNREACLYLDILIIQFIFFMWGHTQKNILSKLRIFFDIYNKNPS